MTVNLACPACGERAEPVTRPRDVAVGRWSAVVDDEFCVCASCGEEFYLPGQVQSTLERAAASIREHKGLISPDRIRALRARYGLTQEQLERLLGVAPKMVVRWERGTVLPALAASRFLEVLESMPEPVLSAIALKHGVTLRPRTLTSVWTFPKPETAFAPSMQLLSRFPLGGDFDEPKEAVA